MENTKIEEVGIGLKENMTENKKNGDIFGCIRRHKETIKRIRNIVLLLMFLGYYGYAMFCSFGDEESIRLTVLTGCILAYISWNTAFEHESVKTKWTSFIHFVRPLYSYGRRPKVIQWFLYVAMTAVCVTFLVINVALKEPSKLRSLAGIFVFILVLLVYSNNRRKINWHCVFWGIVLQGLLGYFVIKSHAGTTVIIWFSDRLTEFLAFAEEGSKFVFGASFKEHRFFMKVLPSVILFCAIINALIHLGTIQFVVRTLGKFLAFALDVSAPEAINACANIVIGGIESTILVKEYVDKMPTSRLFALVTNWFATSSGSGLILFMSFGVPLEYLLAASAMSAPAGLACAKLAYPDDDIDDLVNENNNENEISLYVLNIEEDEKTIRNESPESHGDTPVNVQNEKNYGPSSSPTKLNKKPKNKASSIWEALVIGTKLGMKVGANVMGVLIVSLSLIAFANNAVAWFGDRVYLHINLNIILSYMFYAVAYVMGVDVEDCLRAGNLLGIKILSAPGTAYAFFGKTIKNRHDLEAYMISFNQTITYSRDDDIFLPELNKTLVGGVFSERSELITSYALCGMASFPAVGIAIGTLSALFPERAAEITKLSFRALVAGTIASLLTACIAGLVS